jgi:prophage regulatory protein
MSAAEKRHPDRYLRITDVISKSTLSSSEIYRRMQRREFPLQKRLGPKRVAWLESEIDEWISVTRSGRTYRVPEQPSEE